MAPTSGEDAQVKIDGVIEGIAQLEGQTPYDGGAIMRRFGFANALIDRGLMDQVFSQTEMLAKKLEVAQVSGRVALAGGDQETAASMSTFAETHQALLDALQPPKRKRAAGKPADTSASKTSGAKGANKPRKK